MTTRAEVAQSFCVTQGHRFIGPVGVGAFKETSTLSWRPENPQALKVYQPGSSPERTSRELSAMQRCSHPNIGRLSTIRLLLSNKNWPEWQSMSAEPQACSALKCELCQSTVPWGRARDPAPTRDPKLPFAFTDPNNRN
jgi:hypothetical protein